MNMDYVTATIFAISMTLIGAIIYVAAPTEEEVAAQRKHELAVKQIETDALMQMAPLMMQLQKCS